MTTINYVLRAPVHADVLPYTSYLADPVVTAPLEDVLQRPVGTEAVRAFMLGGVWCPFTIDVEGLCVGFTGLTEYQPEKGQARFFIVIGARHLWGQGLGSAVIRQVVHHGFQHLGLRKIVSDYLAFNSASAAIHHKVGFVEEGRLRDDAWRDGQWHDRVFLSILRREFEAGDAALKEV